MPFLKLMALTVSNPAVIQGVKIVFPAVRRLKRLNSSC
jgi:hypothetical protein